MEFTEVVARRRMVRRYLDVPVDAAFLRRALTHATRAPSAGFTQGWSFLVLHTPDDVARFWNATSPRRSSADEVGVSRPAVSRPQAPNSWLDGMRTAPAVIVVLASEAAYADRYGQSDKASAATRAANMPWWQIDAAMAALHILQTATDEGLGACFFGVPADGVAGLRAEFGIPDAYGPIGAITLGAPDPDQPKASPSRRARRRFDEVVHAGNWGHPLP